MLSKSANPILATPSQAPRGEGVETGREPPDRVTAKVKAQSRPRTLGERAAVKAEVAWDQESPGSSPGGAIRSAVGRSSHRASCFGGRCVPSGNGFYLANTCSRACAPGPRKRII